MDRIADAVYQLRELDGGPTLLLDHHELTLVDAGNPGEEGAILAAIESLGRDPSLLRHILITHSDRDHVGALAALVRATGASVYAEPREAAVIEGRAPDRNGNMIEASTRVNRPVDAGQVLSMHGGVRVVGAFGHTAGHVAYLTLRERVLFVGDSLNNNGRLTGSRPGFTYDEAQAIDTVRALARLDPASVCFGHGPALVGDAGSRLQGLAKAD